MLALESDTGRVLWRVNIGGKISAGVGSDGTTSAVVTREGELVALEGAQVKWKMPLAVRVATAPLVAGGRVFVLGVDRSVHAFDAADGVKLWQVQRPGDPLMLSQTGVLAAFKNTLIVGQGPRMAGLDPTTSMLRWEVTLGSPRGANEVERLADLVGPVVRSRRSRLRTLVPGGGRLRRRAARHDRLDQEVGGTDAIAGDADMLFGADALRPAERVAHAERRHRLDLGVAHVPRTRARRPSSASRSSSATPTARCTSSRAPRASRWCA